MATNSRASRKLPKWADRSASGTKLDTAVFVGIVKNNLDPARSGRLQVWIPDLGGQEDDEKSWRTISYASPFFGSTYTPKSPNSSSNNSWDIAPHTYGMWAVPPDLDNQVLCIFANGDPDRGYWFACVPGVASTYMTPGLAAGNNIDTELTAATVKSSITTASSVPVTEFNENKPGAVSDTFYNNPKPVHEAQYKRLLKQGLDKDKTRGAITSSSQREAPSSVFGISTPGRFVNDTATNTDFQGKLEAGTLTSTDLPVGARQGGHQFVMDDGDILGVDNLVRLRTAGGHQLLMNDSKRLMYIANSEGSIWLEFAENGQMHIYSAGGLNIRTEGDLNLHSDKSININAEDTINIKGKTAINAETNALTMQSIGKTTLYAGGMNIGSGADINLYADGKGSLNTGGVLYCVGSQIKLNSGGGVVVNKPAKLKTYVHNDASQANENVAWEAVPNALDSVVSVAPGHEPWIRQTGVTQAGTGSSTNNGGGQNPYGGDGPAKVDQGGAPRKYVAPINCVPKGGTLKDGSGNPVTDGSGNPVKTGTATTDAGPALAEGKPVSKPVPKEWLSREDAPNPPGGIGPLSQFQVKCLMTQIGYSESRFNYEIREASNGNYLGRYQLGSAAFTDLKYMKTDYYSQYKTKAVRYPDAWYGKNEIFSDTDYLANKAVQEQVMFDLMTMNYNALIKKADGKYGINTDDDLCTVAGMICVAHLLGAGGARRWRYTAAGGDANGTDGATYYNRGRYAIDILALNGGGTTGDYASTGVSTRSTGLASNAALTPAASAAAAQNITPTDVIQFTPAAAGNTGTGTLERFNQCDNSFRAMVLGAAKEFKEKTGQKLICNSSLRTADDQTKLYNAWVEGGGTGKNTVNTKYGRISMPLKSPGNHGRGVAMDCPAAQIQQMQSLGLLAKYGLQWLSPNDPPHIQTPINRG